MAEKAEEIEALEARYLQALLDAEERGVLDKVEEFEAEVQTMSQAVVGMNIDTLCRLATSTNEIYSNYQIDGSCSDTQASIFVQ